MNNYKTQLVFRGFNQNPNFNFINAYSPVVKAYNMKMMLSLVIPFHWNIQQIDINNAFLNQHLFEIFS